MASLEEQEAREQLKRENQPWLRPTISNSPRPGMIHVGSAPQFASCDGRSTSELSLNPDEVCGGPSCKVALEISLCTCFRCSHCSTILYDEEIMEGWTADESNLNTQCPFCKESFVPVLSITIRDMRIDGSCESLLTPAQSIESIRSTPVLSSLLTTPPLSVTSNNMTSVMNSHSKAAPAVPSQPCPSESDSVMKMAQRDSVDSCPENFMLFEDSQFDLATASNITSPSDSPLREKPVEPCTDQENVCGILVDLSPPPDSNEQTVGFSGGSSSVQSQAGSASLGPPGHGGLFLHCPNQMLSSVSPSSSNSPQQELLGPITVPYLSPLVLRKEVENVLDHEGDDSLTRAEFVDQHPIIYWNLVYYFRRIGVPSHLPGLCLQATSITKGRQIPDHWQKFENQNVSIHCLWDNPRLHEDLGQPLYQLWQQNAPQSPLVHALVTEEKNITRNLMLQMLWGIQHDDLLSPIKALSTERLKRPNSKQLKRSIYRELYFLAIAAIGKDNLNLSSFDVLYTRAYEELSRKELLKMQGNDRPPSDRSKFCRASFNSLELKLS